jgi:DNA-binding transcriptional MerR regulator
LDESRAMRIGELARRSGLSVDTIRYYGQIGVLPSAERDWANRRGYGQDVVVWIAFLGRLKTTGVPIREIAKVAALTAMGNATPQLKVHIEAGLNVGPMQEEIVKAIMQMAVHAGFPAALNGLFAAAEAFAARGMAEV